MSSAADTGVELRTGLIGARAERVEDARLLTGRGRYVGDVVRPRMVEAAFVRSEVARGRVRRISVESARRLEGVLAIWTGAELSADTGPLWDHGPPGYPYPPILPLAGADVRYVGDPIAIVVAVDRYVAEDACDLVEVEIDPEPPVVGREQALATDVVVHAELAGNVAWESGEADETALEAVFAASDLVVAETIRTQRYLAAPMETRGLVASFDAAAQTFEAWTASQTPHQDRVYFARVLGIPESRVRVISGDVGGGFGQKYYNSREEAAVALASRRLGRPVRYLEDRLENLVAGTSSRDEQLEVRLGLSADGEIRAAQIDHLVDVGAYPQNGPTTGRLVGSMFPAAYRIPTYGWKTTSVYTNTCGRSAYRGPWLMETVGREIVLDIAARALELDPVELRRRNLITADELPYTTVTGRVYESIDPQRVLDLALETIGYDDFRSLQSDARREGRLLGIGVATYVEPTGMGGQPFHAETATVRIEPSGGVTVLLGTGSPGNSIETTIAQVVADRLELPLEAVVVHQGDTGVAPAGSGTGGSRTALAAGGAALLASTRVREKLWALAAHLLGVGIDDVGFRDGVFVAAGGKQLPLRSVARTAYAEPAKLPVGMELGLETTVRYDPPAATYSQSTHACTCEVDRETGCVRLLDYVVASDCGILINPMVVDGQIAGGVAQGIGGALLENFPFRADGTPLARSLDEYLLPTAEEIPEIRTVHAQTPSQTPGGFIGMAEGSAIASPPAVANAVADALAPLGVHVTSLPLTPATVLDLIDAAREPVEAA